MKNIKNNIDKQKEIKSKTNKILIGRYGEEVARRYLKTNGYVVLRCNIRLKIGEIDILAFKNKVFHIVEVKTMSYKLGYKYRDGLENTKNVFDQQSSIQPEENLSKAKIRKLRLLASELPLYISEQEPLLQIDAITVRLFLTGEMSEASLFNPGLVKKIKLKYIPFL